MNCGFCGKEIPETIGPGEEKNSCGGCPGGCRKIHCPHCGYANPAPGKFLSRFLKKSDEKEND